MPHAATLHMASNAKCVAGTSMNGDAGKVVGVDVVVVCGGFTVVVGRTVVVVTGVTVVVVVVEGSRWWDVCGVVRSHRRGGGVEGSVVVVLVEEPFSQWAVLSM